MNESNMQNGRTRVLVVDDSRFTRTVITDALIEAGYEVFEAATGTDGLRKHGELRPDAVVLDMCLPDQSGFALLPVMKESQPTTPVLVLSGIRETNEKVRALRIGADDFVTKPFVPEELAARVDVLVRLRRQLEAFDRSRRSASEEAGRDPVTRLSDRGSSAENEAARWMEAVAGDAHLAAIWLDVDRLAHINEAYGDATGDAVLRQIAASLRDQVRADDLVISQGEDEFLLVLPGTPVRGATTLARRLKARMARQDGFSRLGLEILPTVSMGVAEYLTDRPESFESMVALASRRCRQAKEAGRNRIVTPADRIRDQLPVGVDPDDAPARTPAPVDVIQLTPSELVQ